MNFIVEQAETFIGWLFNVYLDSKRVIIEAVLQTLPMLYLSFNWIVRIYHKYSFLLYIPPLMLLLNQESLSNLSFKYLKTPRAAILSNASMMKTTVKK